MGNAALTGLNENNGAKAYDFKHKVLLSAGGFGGVYKIRRYKD